jgi:UDP-hydrolysing UDP-N-acetyl-D-glucosamine 2-epimerase
MKKRIVGVFTGNRAEYGLQFPILKALSQHPQIDYRLVVSGAHLDKNFGKTMGEIQKDGFTVHSEVKIEMGDDTLFGTAQAIGSGILSISKALSELRPDLWVVYADRFEGFAAVIAGTQMNIPTAHIEGGDITEGGALDDSVRHAMTKLSHIHFTTNEEAAERVRSLGEETWRVHNVGFPIIDLIADGIFAKPEELKSIYNLDLNRPVILFTQHSVTTQYDEAIRQLEPSLRVLADLAKEGVQVIMTYPNNDAGGRALIAELEKFMSQGIPGIQLHKSLGRYNYHGVLNLCGKVLPGACVGNSSSGIKETPVFGCPTVDIGSRQEGRLSSTNVLRANYDYDSLMKQMRKALFDKDFRKICSTCENPYGKGGSGKKIAEVLASVELGHKLITKKMSH